MDVTIGQITTSIRATDADAGAGGQLDEATLDRLARLVLERLERARQAAVDRSLAPEDPAGVAGRHRETR